ncbi:MAG: YkvA family protein [Burkholderiales bacterium]
MKRETMALCLAVRDPRRPIGTKIFAGFVVAHALSPIDPIPDFIPVLGYLDDVILVPVGIAICLRLIHAQVLADSRVRAESVSANPKTYTAAVIIVFLWLIGAVLFSVWLYRAFFANSRPSI